MKNKQPPKPSISGFDLFILCSAEIYCIALIATGHYVYGTMVAQIAVALLVLLMMEVRDANKKEN